MSSPERSRVLSEVEGRCRESSAVEITGKFYYFSYMIYKNISQELYYVYIIECNDGSFYTGLTNDLLKRFSEHCEGVYTTCYTFKRRPLILRYYETIPFSLEAAQREKQLKGWSRSKKLALMNGNLHKLSLLSESQNLSHSKYRDHR